VPFMFLCSLGFEGVGAAVCTVYSTSTVQVLFIWLLEINKARFQSELQHMIGVDVHAAAVECRCV